MTDTRIRREEIKGIAAERKCQRADAADINEGGSGGFTDCDCEDGACEWHEEEN